MRFSAFFSTQILNVNMDICSHRQTLDRQDACAPVAADADGEVHLVFGVGVGGDAVDAAFEDVGPAHLQKGGQLRVVAARDEPQEIVLVVFVEDDLYGVGVVRVLYVPLETQGLTNTQIVPYEVGIVVLAAS